MTQINYDDARAQIDAMDSKRADIYEAVEQILQLAGSECTDIWQGGDADGYRSWLSSTAHGIYKSTKWMNDVCWSLKVYINSLEESEINAAAAAEAATNDSIIYASTVEGGE